MYAAELAHTGADRTLRVDFGPPLSFMFLFL
jgi:hypothetical protein